MRLITAALLSLLLSMSTVAQCGGNGGQAFLETTPQAIGTTVTFTLGGISGAPFFLYSSGAIWPLAVPGLGTVCLDIFDPGFGPLLDGTIWPGGEVILPASIANDPALLAFVTHLQLVTVDAGAPSSIGLSRAMRLDFEVSDSHAAMPSMSIPRTAATGNLTGDGRVLIAGGGSGYYLFPVPESTTEIFDPLTRTVQPGPNMSAPRTWHTATTLLDGRVLIAGGSENMTPGVVSASVDIFDPATNLIAPTGPLSAPRVAHTATLLPDGRVLVAGGTGVPLTNGLGLAAAAALDTGEIYDPATGLWTIVPNSMQSVRMMAAAESLPDGRVLLISGIDGYTSFFGAYVPAYTPTVDYFDPTTGQFSAAPSLSSSDARAAHSARLHAGTGNILVAGGFLNVGFFPPTPTPQNSTRIFNGASWVSGPTLPAPVAVAAMIEQKDGNILIAGGINGALPWVNAVTNCVLFNGTTFLPRAPLPAPMGGPAPALLTDGGIMLAGGIDSGSSGGQSVSTVLLYTPAP